MTDRKEVFEVGDRSQITVNFPSGRLAVRTGPDRVVEVTVASRRSDEFVISQVGTSITVRYEGRGIMVGGSHQIDIVAPASSRLEVSSASADIDVERAGELEVRLASGDVRVQHVDGDLSVKTASGDAMIGAVSGRMSVASASGDVSVQLATGDCTCTTVSGDIDFELATNDVVAKSVSGDVTVKAYEGSRFNGKTLSGDIELYVPKGRILDVDLVSRSGRCRVPDGGGEFEGERKLVDVVCKSVSGDIKIGLIDG